MIAAERESMILAFGLSEFGENFSYIKKFL
jgi:hypothetical protein